MHKRSIACWSCLAIAALAMTAGPAFGAGFNIFEQGSKAMGMAGAFTAQADDPSAVFHNPAGLAFQKERDFAAGTTIITISSSEFEGSNPFPGVGVMEEQEGLVFFPSHIYYVQPINQQLTFGFGFYTPYGLTTEWENPETFSGRFISQRAELQTFDLNPVLAWQATPNLGLAVGAVYRLSTVELDRAVPFLNPFTQSIVDIGSANLKSDIDGGVGFTAGLLHKVNNSFSWGLTYRSKVEIDYEGDGRFSQISTGSAALDAAVAATIPFDTDLPIATSIEFPDTASLGLAFALSPTMLLETDFNWTGWSSFDELSLQFPTAPQFSQVIPEEYEDAYNYRIGLRWAKNANREWRFGYVFDESPQPEEAVSPLLPDADRNGFTIGYGWKGAKRDFDLAFMYLPFDERTRQQSFASDPDDYFGTYETTAFLLGATLTF